MLCGRLTRKMLFYDDLHLFLTYSYYEVQKMCVIITLRSKTYRVLCDNTCF